MRDDLDGHVGARPDRRSEREVRATDVDGGGQPHGRHLRFRDRPSVVANTLHTSDVRYTNTSKSTVRLYRGLESQSFGTKTGIRCRQSSAVSRAAIIPAARLAHREVAKPTNTTAVIQTYWPATAA